jgi:hypothetical protein
MPGKVYRGGEAKHLDLESAPITVLGCSSEAVSVHDKELSTYGCDQNFL